MTNKLSKLATYLALSSVAALAGCASSPMKDRLNKNFVYNCALDLIDKNVPAADAERICTASHKAEASEAQQQKPAVIPARAPANIPALEKADPGAESAPAALAPAPAESK